MKDVRMMPLRAGTPHPPQTRHLVSPAGSVTLEGKQHSVVSDVRAPLCYLEEKADGSVSVWDGYKTVCFLKEELKGKSEEVRGRSEEVIVKSEEVLVRILDDILPSEAARLYIEYLELIRSCPRYRTEKAVNCKDMGTIPQSPAASAPFTQGSLEMKPKKIKIRILEGEKVV